MTADTQPNQAYVDPDGPSPALQFKRAISHLLSRAKDVWDRYIPRADSPLPAPEPTPQYLRAAARAEATYGWVIALARTMAGDRYYVRPWRLPRMKSLPGMVRMMRIICGVRPTPPSTEDSRLRRRINYIRKVMSTQPVGKIARRIAGRLHIKPSSGFWPHELVDITDTPQQWANARRPKFTPLPAHKIPPLPIPAAARKTAPTPKPPFHPRE